MRRLPFVIALLVAAAPAVAAGLQYPAAPRGTVNDTYFGTTVADPYRWMEDVDSPQTMAWAQAENNLTRTYLDAIPTRRGIRAAYTKLLDFEKVSEPFHQGRWWFYTRNSGLQNQSVLYVRDGETGRPRILIDPNRLAGDGTVALAAQSFTSDGKYLAYATQSSGSDWMTWRVKDVASGNDLPDRIEWSKFSRATWLGDRGFYYAAYDKPAGGDATLAALGVQKLYFHRLGTAQSADRMVYASYKHPEDFVATYGTEDDRYIFLFRGRGEGNSLAWKRSTQSDEHFHEIFGLDPNITYKLVGDDGSRLYLVTNRDAPRWRIVSVDLHDATHTLHDVIPQTSDQIEDENLIGDRVYVEYTHDAHSIVKIFDLHGRAVGSIDLPGIGTGGLPSGHRTDRLAYYTFESFTYPATIYRYDTVTRKSVVAIRPRVAFDPSPYRTEQLSATSKDGTRVNVFVMHRKDMVLDGSTPTILYGYGGFNDAVTPYYSSGIALWLQMGGAYAVATLRGGGEYGEAWHDAGRLGNKQNVFDDFIAAAQMLIDRKITSTPRLAISGTSNGGLLVGAVETQRPDLFGAAIPDVGVFDMLRYQEFTVGKAWIPEFGASTESAASFAWLYAYSPLHNVKDGTHYPPTLVMTSDHDDRVFPAHSFKFTASLQHAQAADAPILLRVESKGGHGAGRPTDKIIDAAADRFAFLTQNLHFVPTLPLSVPGPTPAP